LRLAGTFEVGSRLVEDEGEERGDDCHHPGLGDDEVAYPGADLKCFEEGYTTDMDEAKLEALSLEVEPTAESLVELLNLDDL